MKKALKIGFLSLVFGGFLASCTTTHPVLVTNNAIGDKVGKSSTSCLFGAAAVSFDPNLVAAGICFNGKYGLIDAAKDGNIDRVATVDLKQTNYILFTKFELFVTGE